MRCGVQAGGCPRWRWPATGGAVTRVGIGGGRCAGSEAGGVDVVIGAVAARQRVGADGPDRSALTLMRSHEVPGSSPTGLLVRDRQRIAARSGTGLSRLR